MGALTAPVKRPSLGATPITTSIPMAAAVVIYEGMAVSFFGAGNGARQLNVADTTPGFLGFAEATKNNTTSPVLDQYAYPATDGNAGSALVEVSTRGKKQLPVAAGGVLANSAADVGMPVYASDGNTFTGSNGGGALQIGHIDRWVSNGLYEVNFYAQAERRPTTG